MQEAFRVHFSFERMELGSGDQVREERRKNWQEQSASFEKMLPLLFPSNVIMPASSLRFSHIILLCVRMQGDEVQHSECAVLSD